MCALARDDRDGRIAAPAGGLARDDRVAGCVVYYVYILANATNVAIYTGVTRDLVRRVAQHRAHADPDSYTARYNIIKLVYFEATPSVTAAIQLEKQIKSWSRRKKNALVERKNPNWEDLYDTL